MNPTVRIGLIIPSSNRLSEPQFQRYAPPDVGVHVTRLGITRPDAPPATEMLDKIEEAASYLADARCDVIVFHCTGSSMEAGFAAERTIVDAISKATGRKTISTATAVLEAFRALGARRVVLASPYRQEVNDHERAFLAEAGVEVLRDRALDLPRSDGYINEPPETWLRIILEEADPRADAYFLSCTNIHSLDVIEELEARLDKPVVASNQATLWHCLRLLGRDDVVPGLGRLFTIREVRKSGSEEFRVPAPSLP